MSQPGANQAGVGVARGEGPSPADIQRRSLMGLNGVNFFVSDMLTGFGPFVTVYLTANAWGAGDIGLALSVGTIAAVVGQVPAGLLVDAVPAKRAIAAVGVGATIIAALILAALPNRWPVIGAELMQGLAASLLTPAINAITLSLSKHEHLGERLGGNVRFKALGSMLTALLMGYIGTRISVGAVFYVAALFGGVALFCLSMISGVDMNTAPARTDHPTAWPHRARREPLRPQMEIWRDPKLIVFGVCAALFQLGNAAVLPTAFFTLETGAKVNSDNIVAIALIVSQAIAALISPGAGRIAQQRGRRIVLLVGFASLVLRCIVLAVVHTRVSIIAVQVLDGLSAACIGVLVPLIVADITRRGGRFNLAIGLVGFAMSVGATLSTTFAGILTEHFGASVTFVALGLAAAAGCVLIVFALPETRHHPRPVIEKELSKHAA